MKLDVKLLRKWIKALRSGQYSQGRHRLVDTDTGSKFCCLGVLADIQGAVWDTGVIGVFNKYEILIPFLPNGKKPMSCHDYSDYDDAQKQARGVGSYIHPSFAGGVGQTFLKKLADENDNGKSFKHIAKRIEDYITANKSKK